MNTTDRQNTPLVESEELRGDGGAMRRFAAWIGVRVEHIEDRAEEMHRDEGGAVLMMVLAGILISMMTVLVLYDAGQSARDKIDAQVSADASAFGASVTKARAMNMIAYANTNKRVLYGISTVYVNAYFALLASVAAYAGRCFKIFPNLNACYRWAVGTAQVVTETLELTLTNIPGMFSFSKAEIQGLENYQQYVQGISPWWAWIEATIRSRVNEGTFAMTWPPPGDVSEIFDQITTVVQGFDFVSASLGLGLPSLSSYIPSHSSSTDGLPLSRREADNVASGIPLVGGYTGALLANVSYCFQFTFSAEHLMLFFEHYRKSDSGIKGISRDGQTVGIYAGMALNPLNVGCWAAYGILSNDVFDYRISGSPLINNPFSADEPEDAWLQATAITAFGYKARAGRNETDGDGARQKFEFVNKDWTGISKALMSNEGYMSMARSEIVFDRSMMSRGLGGLGVGGFGLSVVGNIMDRPDMWNPRWTAKLRPVTLPGEEHGTTVSFPDDGSPIGLSEMAIDSVPFLILSTIVGLTDPNFGITAMLRDALAFSMLTQGFDAEHMEGIEK